MKFFRQKSSEQKKLTICSFKINIGSIDEIVKKLRIALNKKVAIDESENTIDAETSDNNIKLYLENLRYNILDRIEVNNHKNGDNDYRDIVTFCDELFSSDILLEIVLKLPRVEFECKKIISAIIRNALLLQIDDKLVTVEYIAKEANILFALIETYKYSRSDITLNCGRILRDCIQHECLARIALNSDLFNKFFIYINQTTTFDIVMDMFLTFRLLLTTHKLLTEDFFIRNHENFFNNYHQLIKCENYVTKRQSLEILGLILSETKVLQLFIMDVTNLKVIVNLFWHQYKHIRFRALNIFNVIVNSQQKSNQIMDFLMSNKDKLLQVFYQLKNECNGSQVFTDQMTFISQMIFKFETKTL